MRLRNGAAAVAILAMLMGGVVSPSEGASRSRPRTGTTHTQTARPKPAKPHTTRSKASRRSASARARNQKGRIARSEVTKRQYMRQTGYPKGRHGYVVDHIVPLACGGSDTPSNMQWQTVAEGKAKDRYERRGCR